MLTIRELLQRVSSYEAKWTEREHVPYGPLQVFSSRRVSHLVHLPCLL